jgi:hypothetical protein
MLGGATAAPPSMIPGLEWRRGQSCQVSKGALPGLGLRKGWIEIMRKLYVVGLALVAVFAFSSVMVTSASAEIPLLAEWLLNGNPVTGTTGVSWGDEILIEDTKVPIIGSVGVECRLVADGWIDANGLDFVSEVLTAANVSVSANLVGTGLLCSSHSGCETATVASPIEVWPIVVDFPTLLYLMEFGGLILDAVFDAGYQILCLVIGAMVEDECKATETGVAVQNGTAPNGAEIPAKFIEEPLLTCKEGGAGSGVVETVTAAKIIPTGGGEVTVSSESAGR